MTILPLFIVSAVLHAYVGLRVVSGLTGWPSGQVIMTGVLLVSALLVPLGMVARRVVKQRLSSVLTWAGLLLMGLFSSLLVLTLLRDIILLVSWLLSLLLDSWPATTLQTGSAEAVIVLAVLVTVLGFLNARRTPALVRVNVPIKGLPLALQGFTLVQISDIHVGPTIGQAYLQRIVDKVNSIRADVVAITGDLVDGKVVELATHVAPLAGLTSRHGTFFVTGNHEYYSGAHAWIDELRRLGLTVLMNEHVVLHHDSGESRAEQGDSQFMAPLVLAGVTDFSAHHFDEAHRSDPHAALEGAPITALVRVLLAHQPRSAPAALEAGFDLQLSGHTHGGQFWPWNLLVRFQQPFTAGLNNLETLWVYTSRGTGYWGPPKRFGAPSEITVLRLVKG